MRVGKGDNHTRRRPYRKAVAHSLLADGRANGELDDCFLAGDDSYFGAHRRRK